MKIIKTELALDLEEKYQDKFTFAPTLATVGSAGYDVRACIKEELQLRPGETFSIPLGFRLYIGSMHLSAASLAGLLLPRSGLGGINGIVLGNLVGLIDPDYQHEWKAIVWNRNHDYTITIKPGMKIAQIIFVPAIMPMFEEVADFEETTTRTGGFNSTGAY